MKKRSRIKTTPRKLWDIIQKVSWEEVALEFVSIYPSKRPQLGAYKGIFGLLSEMQPVPSESMIVIEFADLDSEDRCPFCFIFGKENDQDEGETLSYTPWAEWLGRDVDPYALSYLSYPRIVAICLFEMTAHGLTEEEIAADRIAMEKSLEEYYKEREAGSAPEWDYPELSAKDVLKRLDAWLNWSSVSKKYFGEDANWFEESFTGPQAPDFYDELDRHTIKAALMEIARDLQWVSNEL